MVNNYLKTREGQFHFFDDRNDVALERARIWAHLKGGKLDVTLKKPALQLVAVYRPIAAWTEVHEIGEYREPKEVH